MTFSKKLEYLNTTKNRKPISLLVEIVEKNNKKKKGWALDLGCGMGSDAKYLAQKGFTVDAVDLNKEAIIYTKEMCHNLPVNVIQKNIFSYNIEVEKYSLIHCWNTLSFLTKNKAEKILNRSQKGLVAGGFFVFSFFGPEDDWNEKTKMSFWNIEEFKNLLPYLDFIKTLEIKEKEKTVSGSIKFFEQLLVSYAKT